MGQVTADISVSADGFSSGLGQTLEKPFGDCAADELHRWMFERGDENEAEVAAITEAGAYIMGRNMFGPIRGPWEGDWNGWWGPEPPYHAPVFVLTHHERADQPMEGGTTFHFVTGGIDEAMKRAREAAGDRTVSIAGGAATLNQYLTAGLVDELRVHIAPVLFGVGERLFEGVPAGLLEQVSGRSTSLVTHITYRKR